MKFKILIILSIFNINISKAFTLWNSTEKYIIIQTYIHSSEWKTIHLCPNSYRDFGGEIASIKLLEPDSNTRNFIIWKNNNYKKIQTFRIHFLKDGHSLCIKELIISNPPAQKKVRFKNDVQIFYK